MIYEKKSTKIMGVIFTILASIIFSLNIISIICTNYYLNANHVKESFLTDANHTIMRSMLVEDLNSTMEQDFPGIDFDYMVDDDMVNQYSEDVMQAILGNKYSFDTRYYENYLEDEIYPELGNRYDLELTDEQADHFHSLYMSVFNGSELATSGEDLSDDFLDGTADNLKYGMWIAAGFALMIVLFILYENKFIAVKNLGIALFTSSVPIWFFQDLSEVSATALS